ncbi:HEAT repeat domain-containing protein [candidate division KSB1 bacterium]
MNPFTLLTTIQNADSNTREKIAGTLDHDLMRKWLDHDNWKTRNAAVKIIGELKLSEYSDTLIGFITDRTPARFVDRIFGGDFHQVGFIRRNATAVLGNFAEPEKAVTDALIAAIGDPYWEVRAQGLRTCNKLFPGPAPDDILSSAEKALNDDVFEVAIEAVLFLAQKSGTTDVIDKFRALYDHPNSLVKQALIEAFKELYDRGIIKDKSLLVKEIQDIFIPGMYGTLTGNS